MIKRKLNESPIAFRTEGEGIPLVLFHGFGGTHSHWDKLVPDLSKNFRVILPNLGPLTLGGFQLTFSEQVDLLHEFKRAIYHEFGKFHLCGISYGGALAWALAATDDDKWIEKLILINPMPPRPVKNIDSSSLKRLLWVARWSPTLWLYLCTPMAHRDLKKVAVEIRVDWVKRLPRFSEIFSRRQKMLFHLVARFSWILFNEDWNHWHKLFTNIRNETQIIHGENDHLFSWKTMKNFSKRFLNVHLTQLKGASHMAIHSSPIEIIECISRFVSEKKKAS